MDPMALEKDLGERIDLHRQRQETIFARSSPPRLTVVLDPRVLRPVGHRDVMAGQVSRLRQLNRSESVDIRVLPGDGAHPAIRTGAFTILDFHHEHDPGVVHIETLTGSRYTERADEVDLYRHTFRLLYAKSVGSGRSRL
jgi:hypothetical protein